MVADEVRSLAHRAEEAATAADQMNSQSEQLNRIVGSLNLMVIGKTQMKTAAKSTNPSPEMDFDSPALLFKG